MSDWVLAKGYAFASTDKGNNGLDFYKDGTQPGDAIAEGAGSLHRYYRIEDGSHLDNHYSEFPTLLRPMLPCVRTAFTALEAWTGSAHKAPPPDATIANPHSGDLMVNTCPPS